MSDLIRRQEAKDAIDMALDHIDHVPPWVYDKLLNALNEVPSAEKAQLSEEDATKRRYTFGNDEFSLEAAYHDCKLVFDGITDDDSFQEADTGVILYYANEIIYALQETLKGKGTEKFSQENAESSQGLVKDLISRADALATLDKIPLRGMKEEGGKLHALVSLAQVWNVLEQLPSAEPKTPSNGSITSINPENTHDRTMGDMMTFPETWEEYEKQYGFTDNEEVYTNGSRLIPSFRVKQWLDHLSSAESEVIRCKDCKYAEVADKEDSQDGYTCQFHRGSIWFSGSYCSWAERRGDSK